MPRSLSTAFERWVIERDDFHVLDEPFSAVYYLGPERVSDRYDLTEPDATSERVLASIVDGERPLFVKDMVHHVPERLREEIARLGRHTLLTRDPARAIPSFAKVWPDVTWEECGYAALATFADRLDEAGVSFDVIDAGDLMTDPATTLAAWCARHGLAFDRSTLQWAPGAVPQWTRWLDFHASAIASTGLAPHRPGPPPDVDDLRIADLVAQARPLHERLVARAVTS